MIQGAEECFDANGGLFETILDESIGRSGAATCLAEIRGGWDRSDGDAGPPGVVVPLPDRRGGR